MSRMLAALRHLEQRATAQASPSPVADVSFDARDLALLPKEPERLQVNSRPPALVGMEVINLSGPCFHQVAVAECAQLEIPQATDTDIERMSLTQPTGGLRQATAQNDANDLAAAEEPYRPDWLPLARRFPATSWEPSNRFAGLSEQPARSGLHGDTPDISPFVLIAADSGMHAAPKAPPARQPESKQPEKPISARAATAVTAAPAPTANDPAKREAADKPSTPIAASASVSPAADKPTSPGVVVPARQALVLPAANAERDSEYRILCSRLLATHFKRAAKTSSALMFVTPGPLAPHEFSLVDMARAASETLNGRLLLVAGDPRTEFLPASLRSGGRGASDVWQSKASWKDVIRTTTNERIDVAGWGADQAAVSAAPFSWAALRDDYQLILLAGPAAITPAVQRLAAACDAVVMLVGLGVTGQAGALKATELLAASGAPLAGCVVLGT